MRRFEVGATLVVAAFLLLLTMSDAGVYLERSLYLTSYFRGVEALGFGPQLDPALRVVMADDASQYKLGRQPTFAEWRQIAKVLTDLGFERVLFAGLTQLDSELGELNQSEKPAGFFATGAVGYVQSTTFVPAGAKTELGDKALAIPDGKTTPFRDLKLVLGSRPEVLKNVDAAGHLNLSSDQSVPFAFRFGDQVLPYLGLYAVPGLRFEDEGLSDDRGRLPRPADNELYVDYPALPDMLGRAVPSSAFFTKLTQRVSDQVSQRVLDVLDGGKVALLIPDAVSGGKHVMTPFGGYPAFTVPIAVTSSVLRGHLLTAPVAPKPLVVAVGLLAWAVVVFLPLRQALWASGALFVAASLVPTALLFGEGFVLPAFGMSSAVLAATGTRLAYFFGATWKQKMLASKDLEMGRTIQALLLPPVREARVHEWSYRIVFEPHGPMSGDWFQTYHVKDDTQALRCVLAIGDVIGKGPSAALNTATITSVWKRYESLFEASPEDLTPLLHELAHVINESYRGEQTTSIQLAAIYRDKVRLISCAAPLWLRLSSSAGVTRVRNKPANPLGMRVDGARFQMVELPATAGELFLAHTDGVMEGSDCFARFSAQIKSGSQGSHGLGFDAVATAARQAGAGVVLPDDVTMLMIQRETQGVGHGLPSQKVS